MYHEQNGGRSGDGKDYSDEVSDGNEELLIGKWRKRDPCHTLVKNLAKLCSCSSVLWEVEVVSDEIGYLAEEISKQSVEDVACLFLTAYSKI